MAKRKIDLKVDELIDAIGQETRWRHPLFERTPTVKKSTKAHQRIFSPDYSPIANKKLMKCTSALLLPMLAEV